MQGWQRVGGPSEEELQKKKKEEREVCGNFQGSPNENWHSPSVQQCQNGTVCTCQES